MEDFLTVSYATSSLLLMMCLLPLLLPSAGQPTAVVNDEVLGTTALVWPSGCVEGVQCLIGESMVSWKWLMGACVYIAEQYVVRASLVKESNG